MLPNSVTLTKGGAPITRRLLPNGNSKIAVSGHEKILNNSDLMIMTPREGEKLQNISAIVDVSHANFFESEEKKPWRAGFISSSPVEALEQRQ
jgi:hypothetical protein